MVEALTPILNYPYFNHILLTSIVWLTYTYTLKCGFVSDDFQGIAEYDGKLQGREYGMISRWIRFHLAGGHFPSKIKNKDGSSVPQGKVPFRHHIISVTVFNLAVVLGYQYLQHILEPQVALMAMILLIIHPITTQGVAWISGLGYPLCLFWNFLTLNFIYAHYQSGWNNVSSILIFIVLQFLSINALFISIVFSPVLWFLGYHSFALVSLVISIFMGLKIVRETINLRKAEFVKQNMGKSTFIKPRKLIVALKTLFYYINLIILPKRLGLYHKWGYHYETDVEREDGMMMGGLLYLGLLVSAFFLIPDMTVKLGVIWFLSFISIFLNWITIQQFVTERYAMIPAIGLYIIASFYLQNYIMVYIVLCSLLLMRTWTHLPTYDNELKFYQSNVWNFENSEVAYGNLGVTQIRLGQLGSSLDSWHISTKINPEYDVPWYNIFSHYKSNAMFQVTQGNYQNGLELLRQALPYIQSAVSAKICHFKEDWTKERDEVASWLNDPLILINREFERLTKLHSELSERLKTPKDEADKIGIMQSLNDISVRLQHIETIKRGNSQPGTVPPVQPT